MVLVTNSHIYKLNDVIKTKNYQWGCINENKNSYWSGNTMEKSGVLPGMDQELWNAMNQIGRNIGSVIQLGRILDYIGNGLEWN